MCAAEAVRHAFAKSAAFVNGLPVGATVSVGVAWDESVTGDLSALFRRADAALYVAKRSGRNRVEMLGPDDASPLAEVEACAPQDCDAARLRGVLAGEAKGLNAGACVRAGVREELSVLKNS